MKTAKKVISILLCAFMLATSVINDGWSMLIPSPEASAMAGHEQNYNDTRIELDFNKNWKFDFTDDDSAYLKGFDDSDWENVDLPHDFSMSQEFTTNGTEAESGNLPGGTGWYRKWFNLYEYYSGDRILLNFDGAYQHVYVYVNGKYVGENHYGYNSFSFEIADYLICSNTVLNLIAVKVVNELPSSRWYSGSGLNRDVTLTIAGPVHVSLYGPRITTPDIDEDSGNGTAEATIKLHNCTAISKKVTVEATVLDSNHNAVSETVAAENVPISANSETFVTLSPKVKNPKLWTLDDPQLYKLQTIVKDEQGKIIDEYHTTFGYREIAWDADKGFSLNDEFIKLKGVCLHHDQGALGAVQEYEAIYRQLVMLKEMGCNAIRTSHNSTSKVVINICNEIGMLVIEEFFDGWDDPKNGNNNDFSKYFNEELTTENKAIGARGADGQKWYQYVIEHTILRDEHDPCVIAWDIGNELGDAIKSETYSEILNSIYDTCKTLDSSRVILHGNNAPTDPNLTIIDNKMDVIGGNYNLSDWVRIMSGTSADSRTGKPFVATESASATSSRGIYYTMSRDESAKQITSYDTDCVEWGNSAAEAWDKVITNDWFSGEFIWTGFDYIGEPTPWNDISGSNYGTSPNSSYFGVVDTAGFEKDSYYLYRSLWNDKSTTLHLVPGSWNSNKLYLENGYVNVAVYSNAKEIRLFLNDRLIATSMSTLNTTPAGYTYKTWNETVVDSSVCSATQFYNRGGNNLYSQFKVKFAAGSLSVKAFDEDGNEITDTVGSSESVSGTATLIAANTWKDRNPLQDENALQDENTYVADSTDYIYVEYEAKDADGNFMNDYNGTLNIKVDDSSARYAEIVGVDNGNPATTEKFQQSSVILSSSEAKIKMFNGRALVILKTTDEEGTVNITGTTEENNSDMTVQGVTVTTVSETGIHLSDELDEVITQTKTPYQVTLYDEFEVVKYHIEKLEKPIAGDNSGSNGSGDSGTEGSDKFEIYLTNSNATQFIADGDYAIFNQNSVLGNSKYGDFGIKPDNTIQDAVSGTDSAYKYESFNVDESDIYTFTHLGSNMYYIQNAASGEYINLTQFSATFGSSPQAILVHVNNDGSVLLYNGSNYLCNYATGFYYSEPTDSGSVGTNINYKMWLYTAPSATESAPSTPDLPDTPVIPDVDAPYEIFISDKNASQYIPDGEYIIFNQNYIVSQNQWGNWGMTSTNALTDAVSAPAGSAYTYQSFNTADENVYIFTHQGNNTYYIKNKATQNYLYFGNQVNYLTYSSSPKAVSVHANNDGSLLIYSGTFFLYHFGSSAYFYSNGSNIDSASVSKNNIMWLYSKPQASQPSEPSTPTVNNDYTRYQATTDSNKPVADGDYVICNIQGGISRLVSGDASTTTDGAKGLAHIDISFSMASDYSKLNTEEENIYTFTSLGNGQYYIKHKSSNKYISIDQNNSVTLTTEPKALNVTSNNNGDIFIYNSSYIFLDYFKDAGQIFSAWASSVASNNANEVFRLYSAPEKPVTSSNEKVELYNTLHKGIAEDFSLYTKVSFEALLRALEDGVNVFKAVTSTNADYVAATKAINDAIAALEIDIKQIKGTLFKYGYNNSSGTPSYSDGGRLMNSIAIEQMKNAILADSNLLRQIKDIIDYDGVNTTWSDNEQKEKVLNDVAEAYARIYTLQFTGSAVTGLRDYPAQNTGNLSAQKEFTPVSLWNLWTKVNTDDSNDDRVFDDGASVQGLGSATLENNVIRSHSAYNIPLSYANDGPNASNDVTYYEYTFSTGSTSKTVRLEYLSGISVYFPDLFTRESLDANGNVTTATKGQFAKYYWDAQFPIFISTDEHGVNTYNFDSKNTNYIVQSSFDDTAHEVDMKLTEVDNWSANGSVSGSGFFPFNYQQGKSTGFTGENAIYHYGFTFEHNFYIPKGGKHINGEDVIFNFSGDDDVYVYIDGVLVLDNGGLHGAREVTINFTECTINYQFAMDVTDGILKGREYELTYSYNNYYENPETCGYNDDTIAALNKLHSVISDGQVHTLNFFYLERGSTDSNCRMSFNLSETSEEVRIIDQDLTLDYGLSVEYDIKDNNNISQAAIDNKVNIEYIGLCAVNEEVESTYTFELPEIIVPFEPGVTYNVDGMRYGDCTIDKEGNVKYVLKSMNMSESEHFYVCAKITGDPTYADAVTYYQIERTTFIPATTIYYEDTYDSIIYTDGKVPENYNNSENKYGLWQEEGTQPTTLKQSADLTDSEANPYGFETNYSSFAEYSGGSSHFVDVSAKNNPKSQYSGGKGGAWPTVDFSFTGTGFDLISITDNTTGAFSVSVKDTATNTIVRNTVVNTFYGYNYGRIYADADGNPTLDDTLTPMYRSENGTCTSSERYYDENGAITDIPHYYDGDKVVESVTKNPAYAYAYGWIVAEDGTTETLYQIPVIKITDLEYGRYNVTVTPTFTSAFGHASVNADGTNFYRVYFDAIKIYSPAGTGDDIGDKNVKDAYSTDDELYPDYLELKDMLIGAESLSETESQGIIFIDGIAALDNDLEKYKNAGPNNELYLARDQAVAFEIWATSVPTDIQLGAKLACGKPQLTISYDADTTPVDIRTAHDTFYSLNTVLPNASKLTWHLVTGADGNKYYTTGTIVIQNTGDEDSILSVTNLKWTFSQSGGKGYFRIPTSVENEAVSVAATDDTPMLAYSLMRMRTADLGIEQTEEPEIITAEEDGSRIVAIKLNTSTDVDSLVITDSSGNEITPDDVVKIAAELDGREVTQWIVTVKENEPGTHIYTIAGAYSNGYVDYSKAVTVTVTVEAPPAPDIPDEETTENKSPDDTDKDSGADTSVFDSIIGFFNRILEFFRALFALFGVNI